MRVTSDCRAIADMHHNQQVMPKFDYLEIIQDASQWRKQLVLFFPNHRLCLLLPPTGDLPSDPKFSIQPHKRYEPPLPMALSDELGHDNSAPGTITPSRLSASTSW